MDKTKQNGFFLLTLTETLSAIELEACNSAQLEMLKELLSGSLKQVNEHINKQQNGNN